MSMQSWHEPPGRREREPEAWRRGPGEAGGPDAREAPGWEADLWQAQEWDDDADLEDEPDEPNGAVVAALVAAGMACAILGSLVVATAASPAFARLMDASSPAGPVAGRAAVTTLAYLVIWPNLHHRLHDRHLDLSKAFRVTIFLVAVGIVGTFPPFDQLFAPR
jgi:hypothetical protein